MEMFDVHLIPVAAHLIPSRKIAHQGKAPFHNNEGNSTRGRGNSTGEYQVFRNVKDFGAKGDGSVDDTAAINRAISSGERCAPGCQSSTTSPAIIYFPSGTYRVSSPIVDYYYTQIIGNPNSPPVIKATSNFSAIAVIDGNPYLPGNADHPGGFPGWLPVNLFYRQIRNLVIDVTNVPANSSIQCIHWPTAQASSLQNVEFRMSQAKGNQHHGVFIEEGSGGFLSDLKFTGGLNAVYFGSQQFTVRNCTINNANNAINMVWDWGWTFQSISINNCSVGLNITNTSPTTQTVGSVTFIDSSIANTPVGVLTSHQRNATFTNGSLVLENVQLENVPAAVQGVDNATILDGTPEGGSGTIAAWAQGHSYTSASQSAIAGPIPGIQRAQSLLDKTTNKYYTRSKPQYASLPASQFLSARAAGATGDGESDDTQPLQDVFIRAAGQGKIVFLDAGVYRITRTLSIPAGSKLVGEAYPVILSSGTYFANMQDPKPVVQVGKPDETGCVELSDFIVGTQGAQAGAVAIEWNLGSDATPSGMWDVHVRIGGFAGSNLQLADCPATPDQNGVVNEKCIGAHTAMYVTKGARGLYMENVWLWTADHDLDDPVFKNITVYSGRGLNMQAEKDVWLFGTSSEHHTLYQYQIASTRALFAGQIQTETAYYQPNPPAPAPFTLDPKFQDPVFPASCSSDAQDISIYGAGLYSFFDNYNNSCSFPQSPTACQRSILRIERGQNIGIYNLNTVGATSMVDDDGDGRSVVVRAADNRGVFPANVAVYR
ncbi:MAG: hypothetical protein LQ345_003371 [Seirophora villosa]|nr:MAG: hypothetical protein LQ345_003371 [Seirophora villosa]